MAANTEPTENKAPPMVPSTPAIVLTIFEAVERAAIDSASKGTMIAPPAADAAFLATFRQASALPATSEIFLASLASLIPLLTPSPPEMTLKLLVKPSDARAAGFSVP